MVEYILIIIVVGTSLLQLLRWYASKRLQNKVYCTLSFAETIGGIEKIIPIERSYVIFNNRKYNVIIKDAIYVEYNKGFLFKIFPQRIPWVAFHEPSSLPPLPRKEDLLPKLRKEYLLSQLLSPETNPGASCKESVE